jgi:hypothetical protein
MLAMWLNTVARHVAKLDMHVSLCCTLLSSACDSLAKCSGNKDDTNFGCVHINMSPKICISVYSRHVRSLIFGFKKQWPTIIKNVPDYTNTACFTGICNVLSVFGADVWYSEQWFGIFFHEPKLFSLTRIYTTCLIW